VGLIAGIFFALALLIIWQSISSPNYELTKDLIKKFEPLRARRRDLSLLWPDVVDDLGSAIRAGLSLPQAIGELGEIGPVELRESFKRCTLSYHSTGDFVAGLRSLALELADPVADKFVAVIQVAYEVGGADLGILLRTLSEVMREELRVKGEITARQSWTVNGAKLAVAAPWVTVMVLSTRHDAAIVYSSTAGIRMLLICLAISGCAYFAMMRIAKLPIEERLLA
jgi:tight adherence protein B